MAEYGAVLSDVSRDVRELQVRYKSAHTTAPSVIVDNAARSVRGIETRPTKPSAAAKPDENSGGISREDGSLSTRRDSRAWPTIASTPAFVPLANRYAPLVSDNVECSDAASTDDQYTVVSSQHRKKRARHHRSPPSDVLISAVNAERRTTTQLAAAQPAKKSASMLGKSDPVGSKLSAAQRLRRRAVFCIDNVSVRYSVEDIKSFVSDMSIRVLSCFQVDPRRRRSDGPGIDTKDIKDRKAFRLCIFAEDRNRLLDSSKWPDSVVVAEWYFKPRAVQSAQSDAEAAADDANQQAELPTTRVSSVDAAAPPVAAADAAVQSLQSPALSDTMDQDNTILAEYNNLTDDVQ